MGDGGLYDGQRGVNINVEERRNEKDRERKRMARERSGGGEAHKCKPPSCICRREKKEKS